MCIFSLSLNYSWENKKTLKSRDKSTGSEELLKVILFCHKKAMRKQTHEVFFNPQYKYVASASIPFFKINVPLFCYHLKSLIKIDNMNVFKFMVFILLKNAFSSQNIESRHSYSSPRRNAPLGSYHHSPGRGKLLILLGQGFFLKSTTESGGKETVNTSLLFLFPNLF